MIISLGLSGHLLDCHVEAGGHDTCRVCGPVTHVYPGDGERVSSPRVARRHLAQTGLLPPGQLPPGYEDKEVLLIAPPNVLHTVQLGPPNDVMNSIMKNMVTAQFV